MHHPQIRPEGWRSPVSQLRILIGLAAGILGALAIQASVYVQQMNLETLCAKANRILRGTVVGVTEGQVSAGGGLLPTVTYKIKVKDNMAGAAADLVNFTMIAESKASARQENVRRLPVLEMPALQEGK